MIRPNSGKRSGLVGLTPAPRAMASPNAIGMHTCCSTKGKTLKRPPISVILFTHSRFVSAILKYLLFYTLSHVVPFLLGVSFYSNTAFFSPMPAGNNVGMAPCPPQIAQQIHAQNVEYFHNQMLMSQAFEDFMLKLVSLDGLDYSVGSPPSSQPRAHHIGSTCNPYLLHSALLSQIAVSPLYRKPYEVLMRLLTHYCFDSRFRTKDHNW